MYWTLFVENYFLFTLKCLAMKKGIFTFLALVAALSTFATTHTVSNATTNPSQFNNLQTALDAASPGDTILLDATSISYGNAIVTKQVHIYGAKSQPGQGPQINALTLTGGDVDGSTLQSLHVVTLGTNTENGDAIDYIEVRRCHIGNVALDAPGDATYSFWNFEGNIFYAIYPYYSFYINDNYDILSYSSFRYNVFYSWVTGLQNCELDHNIFTAGTESEVPLQTISYTTVSNNIFYKVSANTGIYANHLTYINNISFSSDPTFPIGVDDNIGSGNITNSNPMFTNVPANAAYQPSYDFTLMAGSPALGAGSDDENLGPVTSMAIFRHDCEPDIPVVRSVVLPGGNTVPAEGSFQITVNSVSHP
jgi:hypothetical protein